MTWYYLSSEKMTVAVRVNGNNVIIETPPIVRKFKGQSINNLIWWMTMQGKFNIHKMRGRPQE